jgi:tape measure domain-containing protein
MLGVDEGRETIEYLDEVAKHTEFTGATLKGFTQELLDAGFEGEKLRNALAAVSDVAARSPNKLEGAQSAIAALSRVSLTGSLDARALRGLKLSPSKVFDQMAHDLGMGQKEVKKKLEAGKIDAETVINSVYKALAEKSGKPLGSVGVGMANTFEAQLEKFKTIPERLFEGLSASKGFGKITGFLGRLSEAFDPASPTGKKIVGGLESMMNRLGAALESVDIDGLLGTVQKGMEYFEAAVMIGKGAFDVLATVIGGLTSFGEQIGEFIYDLGQFVGKVYDKAVEVGSAVWRGIKDGMLGGLTHIGEAAGDLAFEAVGKIKGLLGIHSPSKVFEGLGKNTARGYEQGLLTEAPAVRDAVGTTFDQRPAANAPMGTGAQIGSVEVNVSVSVGQPGASAEEIAEATARTTTADLLVMLERLNLSGGAA